MVQINFAAREVNCKIVYYGPGRSGKTTNLEIIHAKAPKDSIGELISIATETDRTLYFDFLPLDLGKVAGMTTKFQLYTVPGQVFYNATRKLVLQGADGVVFVADSNPDMVEENAESLENLIQNLRDYQLDIADMPFVFQWNKRDLPNALPVEELNKRLNRWNVPHHEAVAVRGEGVFATLKSLSSMVIKRLNQENAGGARVRPAPAQPSAPAPVAARPASPPAPSHPPAARPLPPRPVAPPAKPPAQAAQPTRPPSQIAPPARPPAQGAPPMRPPAPVAGPSRPSTTTTPAARRPASTTMPGGRPPQSPATPPAHPAPQGPSRPPQDTRSAVPAARTGAPIPERRGPSGTHPAAAASHATPPHHAAPARPPAPPSKAAPVPVPPPQVEQEPIDEESQAITSRSAANPVSEEIRRRKEQRALQGEAEKPAVREPKMRAALQQRQKRGKWALVLVIFAIVIVLLGIAYGLMLAMPDMRPSWLPPKMFSLFKD